MYEVIYGYKSTIWFGINKESFFMKDPEFELNKMMDVMSK